MRTALTIAGSDTGGGAGIQADLKTFSAFGVYGTTVITALTAQNTFGVHRVVAVDPQLVCDQIDAVAVDFSPAATKIGMLATGAIIDVVAGAIARHQLPNVVLDPVLRSSSSAVLLERDAVSALTTHLLPLARVVMPNLHEASILTGRTVTSLSDARCAAEALVQMGAQAAIVTGGHLDGPPTDVCFDGSTFTELTGARIETRHTHGTGCTFSSAVAARLALGDDVVTAARTAKLYVERALAQAPGLGGGHGPLQHFPV